RPYGRGRILLSGETESGVRISHEFLSDVRDLQTLIDACKLIERLYHARAWREVVVSSRQPNPVPSTDAEWEAYIRRKSAPSYHPAGTCRMGSDKAAVVDASLQVQGTRGLRVVDASVMPAPLSANTN